MLRDDISLILATDEFGNSALHWAGCRGAVGVVLAQCEAGGVTNLQNEVRTPDGEAHDDHSICSVF